MTAMASRSVSVIVRGSASSIEADRDEQRLAEFLRSTGFAFELVHAVADERGEGLRQAVCDAHGSVMVIAEGGAGLTPRTLGDLIATVESKAADIVFVNERPRGSMSCAILRRLLAPLLPGSRVIARGFSGPAASLAVAESQLGGEGLDLEVAFLASKYGLRVESMEAPGGAPSAGTALFRDLAAAIRIRLNDRKNLYRPSRRCPVCFSSEVKNVAQLRDNIVRGCSRCKCRFLARTSDREPSQLRVQRAPRAALAAAPAPGERESKTARARTSVRRLQALRRQVPPRGRILEVGVRDGSFGVAAAREYEYVGIDASGANARMARRLGLEAYCSTITTFVNTGPAFDAVALFHVLESVGDPHDALARLRELLKPGGVLVLTSFDTEGLLYLATERKRMAQNFRSRLILYSRSALIELLEHSGFELLAIGPDWEYRDRRFLRHRIGRESIASRIAQSLLGLLPDPMLVSSGSIRIVARRRAGPPFNVRPIRAAEPTHAR